MRYLKASGLTRANAIFALALFGSWAVLQYLPNGCEIPWALLVIAWATTIRWWMVAGLFLGLLLQPIQLHMPDVAGTIGYAACGALFGLAAELVRDEAWPPAPTPIDTPSDAGA